MSLSLPSISLPGFLTPRAKLSLGLDIGSHAVKICELANSASGHTLVSLGSAMLPAGAVEDGVLQDPAAVAEVIGNLVKNLKVKSKKAAISISGYSVIVKKISLPSLSDEEMEKHIHAEAEQYIPFDIDDVYLDFQNLHTASDEDTRTDVMLVAAKKDVVDGYLAMLKHTGLTAGIVDIDAFALENAFGNSYSTDDNVALVDIGASKMNINILQSGASILARDVAVGSRQLTEQIKIRFDLDADQAESLKIGRIPPEDRQEELEEIFLATCSTWINEIKRALDFFATNFPDETISRLILSGGGSRVHGFDRFLERETAIPTELFAPFKRVSSTAKRIDPNYLRFMAPEMAIAVGLASRPVEF